jgi:membrane protein implicated in regulation of membrane protease activity
MIDYLAQHLWLVWTLIAVLALILEVTSGTFYILCFAIGAFVSVIVSLFYVPLWLQVLLFVIVSVACVFTVRPLVIRYLHPDENSRASNADALIGRVGVVIEPIEASKPGYVKIDGDEWRAVAASKEPIARGMKVRVVNRESIVVTVETL